MLVLVMLRMRMLVIIVSAIHGAYYRSGTALGALHILSHLILTSTVRGGPLISVL